MVFNLSVEGSHEFYANDVLVHNCDVISYSAQVASSLLTPPILTLPDTYGPRTRNVLDDYSLKDPERRDGSGVGLNES